MFSVQVANEFVDVARRKMRWEWDDVVAMLAAFRAWFGTLVALTHETHVLAIEVARRHGLRIYDGLILGAAKQAGCRILYTEDLQDAGRRSRASWCATRLSASKAKHRDPRGLHDDTKTRRRADGRRSAEREVSLSTGKRSPRQALEGEGYRSRRSTSGRTSRPCSRTSRRSPMSSSTRCTAASARTARSRASLEILRLPYTHSGVLASAPATKDQAKVILKAAGVLVPEGVTVHRSEAATRHILPPPYVAWSTRALRRRHHRPRGPLASAAGADARGLAFRRPRARREYVAGRELPAP